MNDKQILFQVVCSVDHDALGHIEKSSKNVLAKDVEEAVKKAKGSYPYGGAKALTVTKLGEVDVP